VQSGSACTGGPADIPAGSYIVTADLAPNCTSLNASVCIGGTAAPSTPTVTSFLVVGVSTITGTAAVSSGVNLWIDGYFIQSTTATAGGTFTFPLTKKLQLNQQVEINSATTGSCISSSFIGTVTCYIAAPVINATAGGQVVTGAQLSGTSSADAGTTITIYNSGNTVIGTTTVQANGTWTLSSPVITASTSYYAKCTGTVCGNSAASNTVTSATQTSSARCGSITGPVSESATSVSGTVTSAIANTVVTLYVDGISEGSTTISGTAWSIPVNTTVNNTIYSGAVLTIGITESTKTEIICGSSVIVSCNAPSTPLISPANSTIVVGQQVTYTVSSSQSGMLYSLRNNADTSNIGASKFGNGSSITLLSDAFNSMGTYTVKIKSTSFSGPGCVSLSTATVDVTGTLPILLLNFTGKYNNGIVKLSWITSFEQNLKLFEMEKSFDGNNFSKTGSVKAVGTLNGNHTYLFNDSSVLSKNVYYRIKMIDNDGTSKYSNIITLHIEKRILVSNINSNPFKDAINLNVAVEKNTSFDISVTDMMGRKIKAIKYSAKAGENQIKITGFENLAKGTYVFLLTNAGELIERQLMIKN
jgi:hypothetical protein